MQLQLELDLNLDVALQPGDRVVSRSGRRGVVRNPREINMVPMHTHTLVQFDGCLSPQWIGTECLKKD